LKISNKGIYIFIPFKDVNINIQNKLTMEAYRQIFIEPNGINELIRRTPQLKSKFRKLTNG